MAKQVIHHENLGSSRFSIVEATLTDGSKVYDLIVTNMDNYPKDNLTFHCVDYNAAVDLLEMILKNTVGVTDLS